MLLARATVTTVLSREVTEFLARSFTLRAHSQGALMQRQYSWKARIALHEDATAHLLAMTFDGWFADQISFKLLPASKLGDLITTFGDGLWRSSKVAEGRSCGW